MSAIAARQREQDDVDVLRRVYCTLWDSDMSQTKDDQMWQFLWSWLQKAGLASDCDTGSKMAVVTVLQPNITKLWQCQKFRMTISQYVYNQRLLTSRHEMTHWSTRLQWSRWIMHADDISFLYIDLHHSLQFSRLYCAVYLHKSWCCNQIY